MNLELTYHRREQGDVAFLKNNMDATENEIQKLKNGFFTVNAVARKPEKQTSDSNPYVSKFLRLSSWQPDKIGVFAGKIDYPQYRFFDKYIIKFIMFITGGPTDTSKSYEFTDWNAVKKIAIPIINQFTFRTNGTCQSPRIPGIGWSYFGADPDWGIKQAKQLSVELEAALAHFDIKITSQIQGSIEIVPRALDKGIFVKKLTKLMISNLCNIFKIKF